MNSLPFMSHHLFVAAIGNDDRGHDNPVRHEGPFGKLADQPRPIALEVVDGRKPMSESPACISRVRIAGTMT